MRVLSEVCVVVGLLMAALGSLTFFSDPERPQGEGLMVWGTALVLFGFFGPSLLHLD